MENSTEVTEFILQGSTSAPGLMSALVHRVYPHLPLQRGWKPGDNYSGSHGLWSSLFHMSFSLVTCLSWTFAVPQLSLPKLWLSCLLGQFICNACAAADVLFQQLATVENFLMASMTCVISYVMFDTPLHSHMTPVCAETGATPYHLQLPECSVASGHIQSLSVGQSSPSLFTLIFQQSWLLLWVDMLIG